MKKQMSWMTPQLKVTIFHTAISPLAINADSSVKEAIFVAFWEGMKSYMNFANLEHDI